MSKNVAAEVAVLEGLDTPALRTRWAEVFGNSPPPQASRDFLLGTLTHAMQERTEGGLSARTRKRLAKLAEALGDGSEPMALPVPQLKPGTRLVRVWQGEVHKIKQGWDSNSRYAFT